MLDRSVLAVINNRQPTHSHLNTKVTITENRAPTDQSIALLKEMEKSAWETIINGFELKTTIGIANIIQYIDPHYYGSIYAGQMNVNGERLNFSFRLAEREKRIREDEDLARYVVENLITEMSKILAEKMLKDDIQTNPIFKKSII